MPTGNTPLFYTRQTPLCFICETAERLYVICNCGAYIARKFAPNSTILVHSGLPHCMNAGLKFTKASDRRYAPKGILRIVEW